jgi:D-arabinose 1-dehydrogenase-like Zn-dependent alcohol dehydrogenase
MVASGFFNIVGFRFRTRQRFPIGRRAPELTRCQSDVAGADRGRDPRSRFRDSFLPGDVVAAGRDAGRRRDAAECVRREIAEAIGVVLDPEKFEHVRTRDLHYGLEHAFFARIDFEIDQVVLHPGGLLVTIVGRRDVDLAARTRTAGRRFAGLSVEPDYPALEALADLAESGRLRVHLQATLDLAEAAKAHELLESGSVTGKIALTV